MKLESLTRFCEKTLVAGAALMSGAAIWSVLAYSPIASGPWALTSMEAGALLLCLTALATRAWWQIHSRLMMFYAVALVMFAQTALTFVFAEPWNHPWWLVQAISSMGFCILSWGVVRALLTTRSFTVAYSQEQLLRALEQQKALTESANCELRASQTRLQAVLSGVQDGVIMIGKSGRVQSFNQSAEKIFGYGSDEVVGQNINRLMPQPYRSQHDAYLSRYAETSGGKVIGRIREVTGLRKDGSSFPMELWVNEALVNGEVLFIGSVRDIAVHKQASEQLRVAAVTFEAQQGVLITDSNFRILRANKALLAETGFSEDDLVGRNPEMLDADVHDASFYKLMWETLVQTGSWQGEITGLRKGGAVYPKWLAISAVKNESGAVSHYVCTHTDITERKRMEEEVSQLAFYDPLTKLANRRLLADRLRQALSASKRSGHYGALIFLDLDNFKPLNDKHGHEVGDLLLKKVAKRLRGCVREIDTVARFGGDEFVVILAALHTDKANSMAQAELIARKISNSLSETYRLTAQREQEAETTVEHHCTASIGVTLFAREEVSSDQILKRADTAMYDAKREGCNQTRFYREPALVADAQTRSKRVEPYLAGHLHAPPRPRSHSHMPHRASIPVK